MKLFREDTVERPFGWVIFYGRQSESVIVGNALIIVDSERRIDSCDRNRLSDGGLAWRATREPEEPILSLYPNMWSFFRAGNRGR